MQVKARLALVVVALSVVRVTDAFSCWVGPRHPQTLVWEADVIVRAQVVGEFEPDVVTFQVLEQLKGARQLVVTARGRMRSRPNLSWRPVPIGLTRREDKGSCAHGLSYQRDGEYLLLLKRVDGVLSPYWALGVTNEQLRGPDDEWLVWVKEQVAREVKIGPRPMLLQRHEKKQHFILGR